MHALVVPAELFIHELLASLRRTCQVNCGGEKRRFIISFFLNCFVAKHALYFAITTPKAACLSHVCVVLALSVVVGAGNALPGVACGRRVRSALARSHVRVCMCMMLRLRPATI